MSSNDEDIGYIKSKLETIDENLKRLESENRELRVKVDQISSQLVMYRHFIVMLRATGVGLFMLLTIKFGDIMSAISALFGKGN
jgi:hypothetical protein